jgi:hypothetical protein
MTAHATRPTTGAWSAAWKDISLRVQMVATPVGLVLTLWALPHFLLYIEDRPGARLADPLLSVIPPGDATWLVFGLLYVALFVGLSVLARRPRELLCGVQAYVLMILSRMCVMYVTPLDPPAGMIEMRDPVVQLMGTTGRVLTRDLFFSGHTSTMFLLFLAVPGRRAKPVLLACTLGVAAGVLRQHVHYTVDVLVAPLFAFASWCAVRAVHERSGAH